MHKTKEEWYQGFETGSSFADRPHDDLKGFNDPTVPKIKPGYKCLLLIPFLLVSLTSIAQQVQRGRVEVIKDPRIDSLALHRLDLKKTAGVVSGATTAFGYRVQIFSGANRREAFDMQSKFQEQYPEIRTYVTYREPNFKVRAGDFRTRLEAAKLMEDLKYSFTGMFIISETINLPKPPAATPTTNE
jgi:hypothetical protein